MAAELFGLLTHCRDKGKNSGRSRQGLDPKRVDGTSYFLKGRAKVVPVGVVMAHATLVADGVSSSAFRRKLG